MSAQKAETSFVERLMLHVGLGFASIIFIYLFPCTWKSDPASVDLTKELAGFATIFGLPAPSAYVWGVGYSDKARYAGLACGEAHMFGAMLLYWLFYFLSNPFALTIFFLGLASTVLSPFFVMNLVRSAEFKRAHHPAPTDAQT